jgi:hypothetical protein
MSITIAPVIIPPAKLTVNLAEALLKDVDASKAARFASPGGVVIQANHPVFVYGHLALYPSRMLDLLGHAPGVAAKPAGWDELFKAGVQCQDDPHGKVYPKLSEVTQHYFAGYKLVLGIVAETRDEVFARPNPTGGRSTELFPTIGAAVNFMLNAHPMSHLGQVSTWRRAMGLGSAL